MGIDASVTQAFLGRWLVVHDLVENYDVHVQVHEYTEVIVKIEVAGVSESME